MFLRREADAQKAEALTNKGVEVFDLLHPSLQLSTLLEATPDKSFPHRNISEIAYYCHTSGTSSGAPKPIPQHHQQLLALLCSVYSFENTATFTTTPLYHGGLPDCLRGWSCGAMTWLFPEDVVPFTPANICAAIELAKKGPKPLWYFSCVPLVLQMLAEKQDPIRKLRSMKLVGVGGAALDYTTGDKLVDAGVKLISRLGSAECGFLMSSNRDFGNDKAWNHLRSQPGSGLEFESRDEGLFELVAKPSWPGRNLANRLDGSYATSDLFQRHETKPNAWRYHSRADSQITLINGKKFDPEPAENHIRTSSTLIRDVLVFGNGKEYAGVILFASPGVESKSKVINAIWPTIQSLNASSQSHARLSKSALQVVLANDSDTFLEKSSKGTILRNKAETRYAGVIESAYNDQSSHDLQFDKVSLEDLRVIIENTLSSVLGRDVDPDIDLFQQGVDSIAAIQVRTRLQNLCVPKGGPALSRSVLYDQGSVNGLVKYLGEIQNTDDHSTDLNGGCGVTKKIEELAKMGNNFKPEAGSRGGKTVVLTGATGFLGAHILDRLLQCSAADSRTIDRVICLVRGERPQERVTAALEKYKLLKPDLSIDVKALSCNLTKPNLGLSDDNIGDIHKTAFLFIHCAWTVNFSVPLRVFTNDMIGLQNLINLSTKSSAHFAFVSSTASVSRMRETPIPETISHDSAHSSLLSYGQSKWAAESNCATAWTKCKNTLSQLDSPPLSIIRVGQLCGNQDGVWNMSEAFPLMLSTAAITGCLPDFSDKILDWLPVEIAAQAITDITMKNAGTVLEPRSLPSYPPVYHVLNNYNSPSWSEMINWITQSNTGKDLKIMDPEAWISRLQNALKEHPKHKSLALVGLWEQEIAESGSNGATEGAKFDMTNACKVSDALQGLQPLEAERIGAIWRWVHGESLEMCAEETESKESC